LWDWAFGLELEDWQIPTTFVPIEFKITVSHSLLTCNFIPNQMVAPILKEVDTALHAVQFNGSFLKANAFRLDAGPEVDAAWESLGVGCELNPA
jgi:hypothetical protein